MKRLLVASLVLALGCSSSNDAGEDADDTGGAPTQTGGSGGGGAAPGTGGTAGGSSGALEFIQKYCAGVSVCCAEAGLPSDGATCLLLAGLTTSGRIYDAEAGAECGAWLEQASREPGYCDSDAEAPAVCSRVFVSTGTVPPGGTCVEDGDCADSTEGRVSCVTGYSLEGGEIRRCQVQITGREGDTPCVATVDGDFSFGVPGTEGNVPGLGYLCHVSDGLTCNGTACVPAPRFGETCSFSSPCADDGYCAGGTCGPKTPLGGSCGDSEQCVAGTFCDAAVCTQRGGAGAACTSINACISERCVNGTCIGDTPTDAGLRLICGGG